MLTWYRSQLKEFGVFDATYLLWRVAWSRARVRVANKVLAEKLECPCCGWRGRRFHDYIEVSYTSRNTACPQCDSHARHRMFLLWLTREFRLQERSGVALVFAPEKALVPVWESAPDLRVYKVDIEAARRPDFQADMQHLPLAADSVDLIWSHHVLEHVEDDRAAMRELARVLRPATGQLIVSVPMETGTLTREYGFADPRETGHWRAYGDDFVERLRESGFADVRPAESGLSPTELQRYGVRPEPFYICTKAEAALTEGHLPVE